MSEWVENKLGEVSEITSSKRIFYSDYVDKGVPFWRSKEVIEQFNRKKISTDIFITEEKYLDIKNKFGVPKKNDILLTSVGTLGIPYIVQENERFYFKDGNLTWIRNINETLLYPKFLYILLSSQTGRDLLNEIVIGSTQEAITIVGLKSLILSLPPLPEQKAIAAVLSSLDDKIDLLHRQNKTLEAMAETLFRQWFIEEAKEDWGEGCLGDVINIFDGKRIPLSKMERDKKKTGVLYPYYGAAQIMDYIDDYIFEGEYILFGEDGTVKTDEGYPVLQFATGKFWVNNHTHILQAKPPYNNFFIWNYLLKKNIEDIITGAVQPKISQGNLKNISFPCFPEKSVIKFNEITVPIIEKIHKNKFQLQTLEKLRDNLLPKLMSGEVRVSYEQQDAA